jgi:hypothetical protein
MRLRVNGFLSASWVDLGILGLAPKSLFIVGVCPPLVNHPQHAYNEKIKIGKKVREIWRV